jgi:hypothetical protein
MKAGLSHVATGTDPDICLAVLRSHPIATAENVIIPHPDQTSKPIHVASRCPSPTLSLHAQCSNVGSQNYTPSHLQALKVLEKKVLKIKFSKKINEMNFERFMERMERAMDAEGVTDDLRVDNIENWFSGLAYQLVKSINDNRSEDSTTVLQAIKEILVEHYGSKKFDTEGMLKKMAEGSPIPRGDFESIQSFVIGLQCKFELAKGKGDVGSFDTLGTY